MTQNEAVLQYLKQGNSLTSLDGLRLFGIMRLGGRILELRQAGHNIHTTMVKIGKKHVALYALLSK